MQVHNWSRHVKILKEIMKFSFLVNFEAFSLQPNSFTGIVLVFFVPLI